MAHAENQEIINKAKQKGVPQWRIAEEMGISEMTLLRWLRHPLSEEKKEAFLNALNNIEPMKKVKSNKTYNHNRIMASESNAEKYADLTIAEVEQRERLMRDFYG